MKLINKQKNRGIYKQSENNIKKKKKTNHFKCPLPLQLHVGTESIAGKKRKRLGDLINPRPIIKNWSQFWNEMRKLKLKWRERRLEEARRNPTEEEAAHNNVVYNSNTLLYIHNKLLIKNSIKLNIVIITNSLI